MYFSSHTFAWSFEIIQDLSELGAVLGAVVFSWYGYGGGERSGERGGSEWWRGGVM